MQTTTRQPRNVPALTDAEAFAILDCLFGRAENLSPKERAELGGVARKESQK